MMRKFRTPVRKFRTAHCSPPAIFQKSVRNPLEVRNKNNWHKICIFLHIADPHKISGINFSEKSGFSEYTKKFVCLPNRQADMKYLNHFGDKQ